jgi:hypothetical protein
MTLKFQSFIPQTYLNPFVGSKKNSLRPTGLKLSAEWQKALSDQGYEIFSFDRMIHHTQR